MRLVIWRFAESCDVMSINHRHLPVQQQYQQRQRVNIKRAKLDLKSDTRHHLAMDISNGQQTQSDSLSFSTRQPISQNDTSLYVCSFEFSMRKKTSDSRDQNQSAPSRIRHEIMS